ncbi:hypothetical protein Bca101_029902 [Brassica carinata]
MEEAALGMIGATVGGGDGGDAVLVAEQNRQMKGEIVTNPLYEQLLAAHVACLRVATPIDQLPTIEAQLSHSEHLLRSYASTAVGFSHHDRHELDNFLAQYVMVLCSFKEQLQQHVRVHAVEAVMACREIENNLHSLTGATLGEGSGATMSEDEDDLHMDFSSDNSGVDFNGGHDMTGFGPLLPTESERSLMERVRQELKIELKQGFKSRIEDVREEIMRKRRAGKLPGDTTTVLKNWWQQHCKWPYPTEDDKAKLVEETGLQLKQINNWRTTILNVSVSLTGASADIWQNPPFQHHTTNLSKPSKKPLKLEKPRDAVIEHQQEIAETPSSRNIAMEESAHETEDDTFYATENPDAHLRNHQLEIYSLDQKHGSPKTKICVYDQPGDEATLVKQMVADRSILGVYG